QFRRSSRIMQRAPRIMRKRATPYDRTGQFEQAPSTSTSANVDDDINEVLGSSGVYIQDGVMMRIQDAMTSEERKILSEETAYSNAERVHAAAKLRRSITVDDSCAFGDNPLPYMENRLPGIADEVESYPCRLCDRDQVFLTGFGLEKHTRSMHPDHLTEVIRQIRIIGEEWKRRNVERSKIKERVQAVRYRHDSLAMAATRELRMGSFRNLRRWNADGSFNYVIPSNQLDIDIHGNTTGMIGAGGPFQTCDMCNVQINMSHPTAHDAHMRAHKRNEEMRNALLQEYGEEFVERVTCHECQLVFTDTKKLMSHTEAMHVRRRKFVCKWCGAVTNSVTELNEHKSDVHAMPPNGGQRQIGMTSGRKDAHSEGKSGVEKSKNNGQEKNGIRASAPSMIGDESHFSVTSTSCPDCSLPFNRPSLLLKHMLRVHSKCAFNASIETKGLPSFSVQVDRGRVIWSCCGRDFSDRVSFSHHRQSHSINAVSEEELIPMNSSRNSFGQRVNSSREEVVVSSEEMKGELIHSSLQYPLDQSAIIGPDGTIEIMVPPGARHYDTQYILVVEPDRNGVDRKKIVAIDPRTHPDEMMRQGGITVGGVVVDSRGLESREGEETIDGHNYDEENGEYVMSSEQFEEFQMQYGDMSNLNIVYIEDEEGNRIEENEENGGEEEDTSGLQHDILEPSEA
ncbi:hypothetical protein PMAYCL1PPCAC_06581, partial [Pristionchus mayeri]